MASAASDSNPTPESGKNPSFTVIVHKKLVSLIGTFKKVNIVSTYAEVLDGLRMYILEKKLFDPRNPIRVCCKGDELSSVLGVEEFMIPEVRKLLQKLVFPVRINKANNSAPVKPVPVSTNDSTAQKRKAEDTFTEGTLGGNVKRSCEEVVKEPVYLVIPPSPKPGSSSDTADSIQGYETAFVKDTSDESLSFESDNELQPGDILAVEETFAVEYEVDSDSDQESHFYITESGSDSDKGENTVITFICKSDSDQAFWADKSSDEEFDSDLEIPESDKWKCKRCNSLNNPPMRYCIKCWFMRTGWVAPKRNEQRNPPPRRKLRKRKSKRMDMTSNVVLDEDSASSSKSSTNPTAITCIETSVCTKELPIVSSDISNSQDYLSMSEASSQEFVSSSLSSGYLSKAHYSSSETSSCSQELSTLSSYSSSHEGPSSCSSSVEFPSTSSASAASEKLSRDVICSNFKTLNLSTVPKCDSEARMCLLCCSKPANASIIHGKYAHQISCYKCARKLQLENKRCPVCRRTIDRVVHQITAI